MSNTQQNRMKETFDFQRRSVLKLQEAFRRDLTLFCELLDKAPRDWTLTVIQEGAERRLVVNVPKR